MIPIFNLFKFRIVSYFLQQKNQKTTKKKPARNTPCSAQDPSIFTAMFHKHHSYRLPAVTAITLGFRQQIK